MLTRLLYTFCLRSEFRHGVTGTFRIVAYFVCCFQISGSEKHTVPAPLLNNYFTHFTHKVQSGMFLELSCCDWLVALGSQTKHHFFASAMLTKL